MDINDKQTIISLSSRKQKTILVVVSIFIALLCIGLFASTEISDIVAGLVTLFFAVVLFLASRATISKKVIFTDNKIGWHSGWGFRTIWYDKNDLLGAYNITPKSPVILSNNVQQGALTAARAYKGFGLILKDESASATSFWLVTHMTTLKPSPLQNLYKLIAPDTTARIVVMYLPHMSESDAKFVQNYILKNTKNILQ